VAGGDVELVGVVTDGEVKLSDFFLCFPYDPAWLEYDCLLFCPRSSVEVDGVKMAGEGWGWTDD